MQSLIIIFPISGKKEPICFNFQRKERHMVRKYILFLKKYPLICAAIAIVYAMLCLKTLKMQTYFQQFILRTLLCGAMAFFLYQISGDKTLVSAYNSTWYVVRVAMGYWIFALPMGIFGFLASAGSDLPLWDNVPWQLLSVFLMFICVGLFEELAFRAVINDAIIYAYRDKKWVFVLSGLVSSLVFGAAHIIGASLSSPLAWAQAIGKTVSAGVFGLCLLFLYWKTRNIWACGFVHGMYDLLAGFSQGIFNNPNPNTSYVAPDEQAIPVLVIYAATTLIELFIFWVIWRKIGKKIDYQKIREDW